VAVQQTDRNHNTFAQRARLRVNGLAQAFYSHFPEVSGFQASLEGSASSLGFLGSRPLGAEDVADRI